MTVLSVATLCILAFVVTFTRSGLITAARRVAGIAQQAVATLRDASVDDLERERVARQGALAMLRASAEIVVRSLVVLLVSAVPLALASLTGLVEPGEVLVFLARVDVILAASVLVVLGVAALRWQKRWLMRRQ